MSQAAASQPAEPQQQTVAQAPAVQQLPLKVVVQDAVRRCGSH